MEVCAVTCGYDFRLLGGTVNDDEHCDSFGHVVPLEYLTSTSHEQIRSTWTSIHGIFML